MFEEKVICWDKKWDLGGKQTNYTKDCFEFGVKTIRKRTRPLGFVGE
jgi:hypothetical protein